mgnify:CR=1 FL=1
MKVTRRMNRNNSRSSKLIENNITEVRVATDVSFKNYKIRTTRIIRFAILKS